MAWDDIRSSPALPALVGGLAGALGGAALMFIASRLRGPKERLPAAYDADGNPMNIVYLPAPPSPRILGFTPGDLIALATVGFSLFRQAQDWMREREQGESAAPISNVSALPPSPAEKRKASTQK
jgi:hypothetical protein